jgi:hypothetical protein
MPIPRLLQWLAYVLELPRLPFQLSDAAKSVPNLQGVVQRAALSATAVEQVSTLPLTNRVLLYCSEHGLMVGCLWVREAMPRVGCVQGASRLVLGKHWGTIRQGWVEGAVAAQGVAERRNHRTARSAPFAALRLSKMISSTRHVPADKWPRAFARRSASNRFDRVAAALEAAPSEAAPNIALESTTNKLLERVLSEEHVPVVSKSASAPALVPEGTLVEKKTTANGPAPIPQWHRPSAPATASDWTRASSQGYVYRTRPVPPPLPGRRRSEALSRLPVTTEALERQASRELERLHRSLPGELTQAADTWKLLLPPNGGCSLVPAMRASLLGSRVPTLAHDLSRVVEDGGVHPLQCPETQRYNFDPYLQLIRQPAEIAWENIPPYVPASGDDALREMARLERARYTGSTSSMTGVLTALYHLVSNFRETTLDGLSEFFQRQPRHFTRHAHKPVSVLLQPQDHIIAIDACKGIVNRESILMDLGHSMERMLTMKPEEFCRKVLRLQHRWPGDATPKVAAEQAFNYSRCGDFMLRAQIDCRHPRTDEPFDLKTRAAAPIRWDLDNYRDYLEYRITQLRGPMYSYEREFYDMIRSVFIKYCFQLRVGRMLGAFVTYHNTRECFGFEFVPLSEMEQYVFGNTYWAREAFSSVMGLFQHILDYTISAFPDAIEQDQDPLKLTIDPGRQRGRARVYVQRLRTRSAGLADPLDAIGLVQSGLSSVDANPGELEERLFGSKATAGKVPTSSGLLAENDLASFDILLYPFVNEKQILNESVQVEPGDRYQALYAFTPFQRPPCLVSYLTALRRGYGIDEVPRFRPQH